MAAPVAEARPSGGPLQRLRRLLGGAAALAAAGLLVAAGGLAGEAAPLAQEQPPRPGEPPRTGGAYWMGRYCGGCHGGQGQGTIIGPQLVGRPDGPLTYELIISRLREPLLLMPDFPPELLPDERVMEIAVYLNSLEPAR